MMKLRQKLGSFGAYTISTVLTMLALDDYNKRFPNLMKDEIQSSMQKGLEFIEFNYFNSKEAYRGTRGFRGSLQPRTLDPGRLQLT